MNNIAARVTGVLFFAAGVWVATWGSGGAVFPAIGIGIAAVGVFAGVFPKQFDQLAQAQKQAEEAKARKKAGVPTDEEARRRAEQIAAATNTVSQYEKLIEKHDSAESEADGAGSDAEHMALSAEADILADAIDQAGAKIVGWRYENEDDGVSTLYKTRSAAEAAAGEDDYVYEVTLEEYASEPDE